MFYYGPKRHKYGAKKTVIDGQSFPSKLEADTYCALKLLEQQGEIKDLVRYPKQVPYTITRRATLDFGFSDKDGNPFLADAKGFETDDWKAIVKSWPRCGPCPLRVYKANRRGIYLAETIYPEKQKEG